MHNTKNKACVGCKEQWVFAKRIFAFVTVYVLSCGPVFAVLEKFNIHNHIVRDFFEVVYLPITWSFPVRAYIFCWLWLFGEV